MRSSNWSSDVCSSDLGNAGRDLVPGVAEAGVETQAGQHIVELVPDVRKQGLTLFGVEAVVEGRVGYAWQNEGGNVRAARADWFALQIKAADQPVELVIE